MDSPLSTPALAGLVAALVAVSACGDGDSADPTSGERAVDLRALEPPVAEGSGESNLAVGPDGEVYLSWLEPAEDGSVHRLRFAVLDEGDASGAGAAEAEAGWSWSGPRTIDEADDYFVNWADFPSILALSDGTLAAHWLQRNGSGTYAYGVRVAVSEDGGDTWSEPVVPHDDGTETEHGFVSLFPDPAGGLGMAWLDGRDFARRSEDGADGGGDSEMSLRYARLADDRTVDARSLVDGRVCDCCQTTLATTAEGPLLVYRDRSADEVRDIYASRLGPDGWSEPVPVHDDGWVIPACPVNGPSADARGSLATVAWFTGAQETPRVRVAFSSDAGASFGEPVRVDDGRPEGRVDVVMPPDGPAVVSWVEVREDGADLTLRRVTSSGEMGPPVVAARTSAARSSGFPRMALTGDRLVLTWTDTSGEGTVRAGWLPLSEVPAP